MTSRSAASPKMHHHHRPHSAAKSLPVALRGALPVVLIEATRKKKSSLRKNGELACPVKPPSLFVKQSPVPARRPLRCVPFTDLETGPVESRHSRQGSDGGRKSESSSSSSLVMVEASNAIEEQGKASKWASLFEAASTSRPSGESQQDQSSKDADAWFDKIFPKNVGQAKEGDAFAAPKLSAQQEKSIQQLQTLVKTLGVATRNPPPPTRRNKPSNKIIRQLPVQGGAGIVDPVPFSSILKKLQSVSTAGAPAPSSSSQLKGSTKLAVQEQEEEGEDLEDGGSSEEETDSETESDEAGGEILQQQEEQIVASSSAIEENEEQPQEASIEEQVNLAKLTVVSLRSIAKSRGLTGFSKMKKSDLVELLKN
ncbi:uncharacterized protein LOC9654803 [Selaginella moellendorffii]|nr:uncharacterized protein LOC9654803 [Selaginella moellendorffii]|eukprot:XP_002983269.2 uncharacterized protein LOC9654803 [Selaginella moellendorffii]